MKSAAVGQKVMVPIVCCQHCMECVNRRWYYPEEIYEAGQGMIPNPYRGRCRSCGSGKMVVGEISILEMQKWEKEGWEFDPWLDLMEGSDPTLKHNIFDMGKSNGGTDRGA